MALRTTSILSRHIATTPAPWLPIGLDHDLVDLALNANERGLDAWHRLRPSFRFDEMTGDQQRLMPLVHRSLSVLGVDDVDLGRMKGLHRNYWYRNQMLLTRVEPVLRDLQAAGIDVMAMKGLPLALGYYADLGLRPMMDADLLVPMPRFFDTLDVLEAGGFDLRRPTSRVFPLFASATVARHRNGTEIDVHWQVHQSLVLPGATSAWGPDFWQSSLANDEFWDRAESMCVGSTSCRVPAPEDLLVHVCVHNAYALWDKALRWAVDAATIIRSDRTLKWDRVIDQAERRRVVVPLTQSLNYLADGLGIDIPDDVRSDLRHMRSTRRERQISKKIAAFDSHSQWQMALLPFLIATKRESLFRAATRVPSYITGILRVDHLRQVPVELIKRLGKFPRSLLSRVMRR